MAVNVIGASDGNYLVSVDLYIDSIKVYDDHDSGDDGEIYFTIKVNDEVDYISNERSMSDGDIWAIRLNYSLVVNANDVIQFELLESDSGVRGKHDFLGYVNVPLENVTSLTVMTYDPSDGEFTYSSAVYYGDPAPLSSRSQMNFEQVIGWVLTWVVILGGVWLLVNVLTDSDPPLWYRP